MKLHEVLETLNGSSDYWFRPVSWKGVRTAYTFKNGFIYLVPSHRGGEPSMTNNPDLLMGDWEFLSADRVLRGF